MVGCVGSDHTTPECRVKLVLTENPDIIFTDLHSSRGGGVAEGKGWGVGGKPCNHSYHFCEIARRLIRVAFF